MHGETGTAAQVRLRPAFFSDKERAVLTVGGLADDVDALFLEKAAQTGAVDLVIVDQKYARARRGVRHRRSVYV